jgi:processive 1,2-diacylglycerol beta-glucosyltransferase
MHPIEDNTIMIMSSLGGGGHVAASEAVKEALGDSYNIEVYNAITDVFHCIDLIGKLTKNKLSSEDSYNFFLKKRIFIMANLYAVAGRPFMKINKLSLVKAAIEFLQLKKPKMVFSVIPFFNGALCEACRKLNIPFWIIPTDIELKTFFIGLKPKYLEENLVKLGLAFEDQVKQALDYGFKKDNIFEVGFPVKKACVKQYSDKEVSKIKADLNIADQRRVITITLGAAGTSMFFKIAKEISKLDFRDLEILACAGRDKRSWRKMEAFLSKTAVLEKEKENCLIYRLASGSRLHLFGFTKKLPEIMAISDLIVAKTGSLSVNEAIHLNKYLLLDHTLNSSSRILYWERPNIKFVKSINKGEGFKSRRDLIQKAEAFLNAPKEHSEEAFLNMHQILPEVVKAEVN